MQCAANPPGIQSGLKSGDKVALSLRIVIVDFVTFTIVPAFLSVYNTTVAPSPTFAFAGVRYRLSYRAIFFFKS